MSGTAEADRAREILAAVGPLAAQYYRLTGKPLGVAGEVAEYIAANIDVAEQNRPAAMTSYGPAASH